MKTKTNTNPIQLIPIKEIVKNRFQPDGVRNNATVLEIAASLKQNRDNGTKGLLQVPTARFNENGVFELAFGHHRYDAFSYLANSPDEEDPFFEEMPLIVRDLTDIEMFELMAIENFHRRDIGPIEEANTLNSYMTNFKKTSAEAAQKFEKTEEYVRGAIRLLNLPEPAMTLLEQGKLNKSQARDLLVAEKLGGATLVQEIIDEIASDADGTSPTETIEQTIRMSKATVYLDSDAGWFNANKKFPVKHLAKLSKETIHDLIDFDLTGYDTHLDDVIKDLQTLISAGMEITDEAFPMVTPESLTRLRALVNPVPCEKCPLHAVMGGAHLCGFPQCKNAKVDAWKKKEVEDEIKKIGIPLYQKSDGPMVQLFPHQNADEKLVADGSADLRLFPAQYTWNNFEGISQNFKVVLVGETAEKRLKKQESEGKRQESLREKEQREQQYVNLKEEHLVRFEWEVVSLAFASMLDGVTSIPFLIFNRMDMIDFHAEDNRFPEGVDEAKMIDDAQGSKKKADGLKSLRRITMFHLVETAHRNKFSWADILQMKKNPVIQYATEFQKIADEWDVKLPKDFMAQAETYQSELDKAIKEME